MKLSKFLIVCFCLLACSPYKKITLTMSEQLTTRWKGVSPDAVIAAVGSYKSKTPHDQGYILRFDFSYAKPIPAATAQKNTSYRIEAGLDPYSSRNPNLVPRFNPSPDVKRFLASDSVIKFMDFYFDKTGTVNSVYAQGYPDSVYYVKRRS